MDESEIATIDARLAALRDWRTYSAAIAVLPEDTKRLLVEVRRLREPCRCCTERECGWRDCRCGCLPGAALEPAP